MELMKRTTTAQDDREVLSYIKHNIGEYTSCLRLLDSVSDRTILKQELDELTQLINNLPTEEQQQNSWISYVIEKNLEHISNERIQILLSTFKNYIECMQYPEFKESKQDFSATDINLLKGCINEFALDDQQICWHIIDSLDASKHQKSLHM